MCEAAAREVREECGIEVEVGQVVGTLDNIVHDERGEIRYHYAIVDFAARWVSGDLSINEELMDAAWITPGQFDAYNVSPKARAVLLQALQVV
jgi:ADP-ribose pyrophosphatase YjhB (NUDIX family)